MYEFHTPQAPRLRIEIGSGDIEIEATQTDRTTVEITARADEAGQEAIAETRVEQRGNDIVIEAPRRSSFFRRGPELRVHVVLPVQSQLDARVNSADLHTSGRLMTATVKTGSGDVRLDTVTEDTHVQAGSGDIEIQVAGLSTKVQSGSGDVRIRQSRGQLNVNTGSGDIEVDRAESPVQLSTGSGDIRVGDAAGSVSTNSASGDQLIARVASGRVRSNSASGDVHIGVTDGTAAWLDVNTLSGSVHSELDGAEPPADDDDTVEVRVNTVSGDITLVRA